MSAIDPDRLARSLSPTQRHCILRFSDAEEWGSGGYGMARTWPDLVYGRKLAQHRTLGALAMKGIAQEVRLGIHGAFRLTPLGLSVQLHVRQQERGR